MSMNFDGSHRLNNIGYRVFIFLDMYTNYNSKDYPIKFLQFCIVYQHNNMKDFAFHQSTLEVIWFTGTEMVVPDVAQWLQTQVFHQGALWGASPPENVALHWKDH